MSRETIEDEERLPEMDRRAVPGSDRARWVEYTLRKNRLGWMKDTKEYDRRRMEILDELGL